MQFMCLLRLFYLIYASLCSLTFDLNRDHHLPQKSLKASIRLAAYQIKYNTYLKYSLLSQYIDCTALHMSLGWLLEQIFYPGRIKSKPKPLQKQPPTKQSVKKTSSTASSKMAADVAGIMQQAVGGNMSSSAMTDLVAPQSGSQRSTLVGLIITVVAILPAILIRSFTFITITLPTWIFTLLSTSLTLTVNMTTLLLILIFSVSTISWVVRYRFMNMYSRLPPEPQRKEPQVEIFPDTQEADSKPGLANYLDEFLSAIKVFGYLERHVFHELTRTMQTRKLIAGETLLLEDEKGFCLVVDGLVQIFVKSNRSSGGDSSDGDVTPGESYSGAEDDGRAHGNQGYSLLTEVKNGAPMSSLFSILSLFTEDVSLRHDEKDNRSSNTPFPGHAHSGPTTPGSGMTSPSVMFPTSRTMPGDDSAIYDGTPNVPGHQAVPPFSLDPNQHSRPPSSTQHRNVHADQPRQSKKYASAHPDIVARASVDTTVAIIPATAFRRLTRLYPKATAHIVQVILTRLQRVTLATGHAYLGLTSEVLRTERLMDRYTSYDLPDFLRGTALERLKDKFRKVIHLTIIFYPAQID